MAAVSVAATPILGFFLALFARVSGAVTAIVNLLLALLAWVSRAVTPAFDLFLTLFSWGGTWLQVAGLAMVTAVIAMLIFRHASNQRAIRRIKDLIISHLLEVSLYRDDLRVVLRAQRGVLWHNLRYLGHALVPLLCMVIPVGVLFLQGELRYAHRPLKVGEKAILAVKLGPGGDTARVRLEPPPGIAVETAPLRIPALNEVDWRIRGTSVGRHPVRVLAGTSEQVNLVSVGSPSVVGIVKVPLLPLPGDGERGNHSSLSGRAAALPGGQIASIRVTYPAADMKLLRWRMYWVWPWLALSLIFGYALKGPLRVQI